MAASYASTQSLVREMKRELQENQDEFLDWVSETTSKIHEKQTAHTGKMIALEENMRTLKDESSSLKLQGNQAQKVALQRKSQLEQAQRLLSEVQNSEQTLLSQQSQLNETVRSLQESKALLLQELSIQRSMCDSMISSDLEKMISMYKTKLGWDIQRISSRVVKMVFSNVDPSDHTRLFSFILSDNNREFIVTSIEPALRDSDITPLVDQLNSDNKMAPFISGMRRLFRLKAIASS